MHFFTTIVAAAVPPKEFGLCSLDPTGICSGAVKAVGGAVTDVTKLPGMILTIANEFLKFFTDFPSFLKDLFFWILNAIFPSELQTWFFGTIGLEPLHGGQLLGLNANENNNVFSSLYESMVPVGLAIAACASGARILKTLTDQRSTSMNVIVDVLVRFMIVTAILIPVGGVSLGYYVIAWSFNAAQAFCVDVAGHLLMAAWLKGASPHATIIEKVFFAFTNSTRLGAALILGCIIWLVFVIYAVVMMIMRAIMIGFLVAMAPLCIATAAFDTRNKFFAWWLDIFTGALAIGPVLTLSFWISFDLAGSVIFAVPPIGFFIALMIMIGSIWMAGKLIHQLTWKHFQHGGAVGAFGAGFGVVALSGKFSQAALLSEKVRNHPVMGPMARRGAAVGYAAQGFFADERGAASGPLGPVMDAGRAAQAVSRGGNGQVVGQQRPGAPAGDVSPSPAQALPNNAGANMSDSDQQELGEATSDVINSPDYSQHLSDQLLELQRHGVTIPPGNTVQGRQDRAQMYWNSLHGQDGEAIQSAIAQTAFGAWMGATSVGAGAGGGAGAGAGAGRGPAGGGGLQSPPGGGSYSPPRESGTSPGQVTFNVGGGN